MNQMIAIIGTAGRDKTKPMTKALWGAMQRDVLVRVPKGAHVCSGGAAWADHLAVFLFLFGHADRITLHLPAPMNHARLVGKYSTAGSVANYYHELFSNSIGRDTLADVIECVRTEKCEGTFEPVGLNMTTMFARNQQIAQCGSMIAYTWGEGAIPANGGTRHTWDHCRGTKVHVPLGSFI